MEQQLTPENCTQQIRKTLILAYQLARENLNMAQNRQKQYYNEHSHSTDIKVDDLIFVKNFTPQPFQPKWKGPYRVLRNLEGKVLEITPSNDSSGKRQMTVSQDHVKKVSNKLKQIIEADKRKSTLETPQITSAIDSDQPSTEEEPIVIVPRPRPRNRINIAPPLVDNNQDNQRNQDIPMEMSGEEDNVLAPIQNRRPQRIHRPPARYADFINYELQVNKVKSKDSLITQNLTPKSKTYTAETSPSFTPDCVAKFVQFLGKSSH